MKSYAFLFWAYNVVWICLAAYLVYLFRRVRRTEHELERLERRLGKRSDD